GLPTICKTLLNGPPPDALELSIDINELNHGKTALHVAASHGHVELVEMLLQAHPGPRWDLDNHGFSALHLAIRKNQEEVVQELAKTSLLNVRSGYEGMLPIHVTLLIIT